MYQVEWDIQRKRYCRKKTNKKERRESKRWKREERREKRERKRERDERDEREKRAHPYELVSSSTKQLGKRKMYKM